MKQEGITRVAITTIPILNPLLEHHEANMLSRPWSQNRDPLLFHDFFSDLYSPFQKDLV